MVIGVTGHCGAKIRTMRVLKSWETQRGVVLPTQAVEQLFNIKLSAGRLSENPALPNFGSFLTKFYIMKTLSQLAFLFLLAFAATSCFSPRSIVQMEADDPDVKWSYGSQLIKQQKDSLDAQFYFDTYTKNNLVFDVEVTNWGKEDVLVAPERIYVKCPDSDMSHRAFNPEQELLDEKINISRQEAAAKNLAVAVGVAAVTTAVAVAATSDNRSNNNNDGAGTFTNITYVSTYVAPPLPAPVLPPSIDFWANYSLRKTTLEPSYKVGGKVVVPRLDACPFLDVYFPVGNETFIARFKQKIILP